MRALAIKDSQLSLTNLSISEVASRYPGVQRVKPMTYYGEPYPLLAGRLGWTHHQVTEWYARVHAAYRHYWGRPTGRFHCHEEEGGSRANTNVARLSSALVPGLPAEEGDSTNSNYVSVSLELPPPELYRRVRCRPTVDGRVRLGEHLPHNEQAQFLQFEVAAAEIQSLCEAIGQERLTGKESVWLSEREAVALGLSEKDAIGAAWIEGQPKQTITDTVPVRSWERMSYSIWCAHYGRLAGEIGSDQTTSLNGLIKAGVARAIVAEKLLPIVRQLPELKISHALGRVTVRVSPNNLNQLLKSAYMLGWVPCHPIDSVPMQWRRRDDEHDILYSLMLNGMIDKMKQVDLKALRSGGLDGYI